MSRAISESREFQLNPYSSLGKLETLPPIANNSRLATLDTPVSRTIPRRNGARHESESSPSEFRTATKHPPTMNASMEDLHPVRERLNMTIDHRSTGRVSQESLDVNKALNFNSIDIKEMIKRRANQYDGTVPNYKVAD